jgi:hypothetical protein
MKGRYLTLVYSSPLLAWFVPLDWLQEIWIPLYVPFAVAIGLVAHFRPRSEMFAWIFVSPFLFWALLNTAVATYVAVTGGGFGQDFRSFMVVTLSVSTLIGALVSAYSILFALGLFALFRARRWLT